MSIFRIKAANLTVEVETKYIRSYNMCRDFITEEEPDFRVTISEEDIEYEREKFLTTHPGDDPSDRDLEFSAILRKISDEIIEYGAFMMHGAVVAVDNRAYLFTAKSGVGKTTHVVKWLKNLPEAYVINGDKPFILTGDIPMACGSPWAGKERLYTNTMVPLKAIILMERAENNHIQQISFLDAFPMIYQQIYRPDDSEKMKWTLSSLLSLNKQISFYHFRFNNLKEDAFSVSYQVLHSCND